MNKHPQHPVPEMFGESFRMPDQRRYEMVAVVMVDESDEEDAILEYMIPALTDLGKIEGDNFESIIIGNMLIISKSVEYMALDEKDRFN